MRRLSFFIVAVIFASIAFCPALHAEWYKGNTHAHSFWSDGDTFPEMEAKWYKDHGYHFLALSDHGTAMNGTTYRDYDSLLKRIPKPEQYFAAHAEAFGPDAIEYVEKDGKKQVRLKTFDEVKKLTEEPGVFLPIQADEVSPSTEGKMTHVTIVNLRQNLPAIQGKTTEETFQKIAQAAKEAAEKDGLNTFWQWNHPDLNYNMTPELLASLTDYNLFEVANCYPKNNIRGDINHWGCEKLWDVANTIRLERMKTHPVFGIASDDTHHYQSDDPTAAKPGRGFIMVRAEKLEADALVNAIKAGDFYCSTGVILKELEYDPATKTLRVAVDAKPDTNYTIEFIGTRRGASTERSEGLPRYSDAVGQVFRRIEGNSGKYTLTEDDLYVRAVIRNDRMMERPVSKNYPKLEQAWTQPVGWEK